MEKEFLIGTRSRASLHPPYLASRPFAIAAPRDSSAEQVNEVNILRLIFTRLVLLSHISKLLKKSGGKLARSSRLRPVDPERRPVPLFSIMTFLKAAPSRILSERIRQ